MAILYFLLAMSYEKLIKKILFYGLALEMLENCTMLDIFIEMKKFFLLSQKATFPTINVPEERVFFLKKNMVRILMFSCKVNLSKILKTLVV